MNSKNSNQLPAQLNEMIENLRQLSINDWEKESLNKDWNQAKAKEVREKKAVRSLHKAMSGY